MTSSGFEKRAKQNMKQPQNVGKQVCCLEENMPCLGWMDDSGRAEELGGGLLQAAIRGWREWRRPWALQSRLWVRRTWCACQLHSCYCLVTSTTATRLLSPSCANAPSYLQLKQTIIWHRLLAKFFSKCLMHTNSSTALPQPCQAGTIFIFV